MSTYTLNIFTVVAERGSFIKAASELRLTPSAISHAISSLESEFGFPLFIRNKYGVTLTENGHKLIPLILEFLSVNEKINQEVNQINNLTAGVVKIGAFHSVASEWLPGILKNFCEKTPNVEIKIYRGIYKEIIDMIEENRIDIAFSVETVARGHDFIPLKTEQLVCITPKEFVPRNKTYITLDEINENKLLIQDQAGYYEAEEYIRKYDLKVHSYLNIDDDDMVAALVENGLGISIIPEMVATNSRHDIGMYRLEPGLSRTIGIVLASPRFVSPAIKLMKQEIMNYLNIK